MEKKTIGSFIAVLRKAKGLTQKDLAEKLNVSDKAVSRWERDECAPDLTLIPVLAEIFGVTTDELLRGERKNENEPNPVYQKEKSQKQIQNLFTKKVTRFKDMTWISLGIGIFGFFLTLLFNFALLRALIGFFAGTICYIAALITQICFCNHAAIVTDEDLDENMLQNYRNDIFHRTKNVYMTLYILFTLTLPCAFAGYNGGFDLGNYFGMLILCTLPLIFLGAIIYMLFIKPALVKKGVLYLQESAKEKIFYQRKLLIKILCISLSIALVLIIIMSVLTESIVLIARLVDAEVFYDYESFGEYISRKEPAWVEEAAQNGYLPAPQTIATMDGEVVFEYRQWNQNVWNISYKAKGNCLPITVITNEAYGKAADIVSYINISLLALIVIDLLTALIIYMKKMKLYQNNA